MIYKDGYMLVYLCACLQVLNEIVEADGLSVRDVNQILNKSETDTGQKLAKISTGKENEEVRISVTAM